MKKLTVFIILFILILPGFTYGKSNTTKMNILVINSSDSLLNQSDARELEILLTHFSKNVELKHISEMLHVNLQEFTHIFYYGQHKKKMEKEIVEKIDNFTGDVIFIGENSNQFTSYSNIEIGNYVSINNISANFSPESFSLRIPIQVKQIKSEEENTILIHGYQENKKIPLLLQVSENRYYLTTTKDGRIGSKELLQYFTEALHNILPNNHGQEHETSIIIDNVHPMSDVKQLKEIGKYLNEKNIPFILAVTPIFITPENNEWVSFSKNNEVLKELHDLQETGGTIIANGYTNQLWGNYQNYEFWDNKHDQFITAWNEDDAVKILKQENFANKQSFDEYLKTYKEIEADYIHHQIELSIHDLVEHELYPLAFKVPQNKISQQGYQIIAKHFTTLIGQIQLSDENSNLLSRVTVKSVNPNLEQMELLNYPLTVNNVDFTSLTSMNEIERELKELFIVKDSNLGILYPSYLGIDPLKELVIQIEGKEKIKWFNLKETQQEIKTNQITIKSNELGEIQFNDNRGIVEKFIDSRRGKLIENVLWTIIGIVIIFISTFFIITIYLRMSLKKRLFGEKKPIG